MALRPHALEYMVMGGTWKELNKSLLEQLQRAPAIARLSGWEERAAASDWYPGTVATEAIRPALFQVPGVGVHAAALMEYPTSSLENSGDVFGPQLQRLGTRV